MAAVIRKTLIHVETTLIEGGRAASTPLVLIAAVAVLRNPWASPRSMPSRPNSAPFSQA